MPAKADAVGRATAPKARRKSLNTIEITTAQEWRRWLADHHDSESEVWLVFYKRHTGRQSIAYENALDEALCFGWIDSLIKRLDDTRYARKFTPRKPDSIWSAVNRRRYAELEKSGRLAPAGVTRAPTDRTYAPRPARPTSLPRYLKEALRKRPKAWKAFEGLTQSERRRYVAWIHTAKRQTTRERRLREAMALLASGKQLGLK